MGISLTCATTDNGTKNKTRRSMQQRYHFGTFTQTKSSLMTARIVVHGKVIDEQTRCEHYHSPADIIAIKFKCCREYYPCFECHTEAADHPVQTWPKHEFDTLAILCGACNTELSIAQYLNSGHQCPACQAPFNPRCQNHYHLYFQI
ncbi:MAG: CHY zinc finger protein [Cyclobacteriaceae bacterium]